MHTPAVGPPSPAFAPATAKVFSFQVLVNHNFTDEGQNFLDETFNVLLAALKVKDKGYDNLDELLAESQ